MERSGDAIMPADVAVYIICSAADIDEGGAKPFGLLRVDESGQRRPFRIVIVRQATAKYSAFVNACPHGGTWLNFGAGEFFDQDRAFLKCGRHGAKFEIDTGACIDGPCKGAHLEPVALALLGGDVCLCGVSLVEEDGFPDPFDEPEDTMDIIIHPD